MERPIKLVILANHNNGCNIISYLIKQNDADIRAVVTYEDSPDHWWASVKGLAEREKLKLIIYRDEEQLHNSLKDLEFDLLLSVSWRHKVSKRVLDLAKVGSINFHNSLLPKHRGAYSNVYPILLGDEESGVTLHWMTENLDDGDIIIQRKFEIKEWDTAKEAFKKVNENYLSMFKEAWPQVDKWKAMGQPQKQKGAVYHSKKDFENSNKIDSNKMVKIKDFINFLRAKTFEPYYKNAYFIDEKTGKKIFVSINLKREGEDD